MIPLKLQIKNFLSYGAEIQTIDFANYPLICFSGKNGHGKSALLDAITWAIWGQARKIGATSKADQGLLHLGQNSMMVIIDFVCNGITYRIRREYSNNFGKPYAILEFGVLQQDTGALVSLTDKTIRTTQDKIEKTLHLDFDTFINSAFLRQGQSNEFSKKSPKERKDIIASILGLNHYESIRKLAAEKIKQAVAEKTTLLAFKQKYEQELNALTTVTTNITLIDQTLATLNHKEQQYTQGQQELEKKQLLLMQEQNGYELIRLKQEQLIKQEQESLARLRGIRSQWRSVRRQQKNAPDYAALEKEKQQLSAQLQTKQTKIQLLLVLKEDYLRNKTALATIEQKLRLEHAQRLQQHQIQLNTLKNELTTAQQAYARMQALEASLLKEQSALMEKNKQLVQELQATTGQLQKKVVLEKQFERRKEYYHRFIALGTSLQAELSALEQKQKLVHDDNDPSCPLCEQNLSASRKKFLKSKFSEEKQFIIHRIARLSSVVKKLKELLVENHAQLEASKKIEHHAAATQATAQEIENQLATIQKKITEYEEELIAITATGKHITATIADEEKKAAALGIFDEKIVQNNSEYGVLSQKINEQEQQTKDLSVFMQEQQHIHETMQRIELQLRDYQALKEQLHLQEQRLHEVNALINSVKQLRTEIVTLHKESEKYAHLEKSIQEVQNNMQQLRYNLQEISKEKNQAMAQKGSLEAQKTSLLQLETEYKEQQKKISELDQMIDDYTIIAQSTGKDGIQALLIEEAIPEIEQEANSLLGKLTDNQAHLSIESLRDLKKGGTKETLDIKISDAVGIRPYELFSGGEAFRIDFALRIAISKLLARRAGTALQTLIIDEGFGSQDEDGLSHIMEAIYKIQEDFERIIVVSHLPSMKEQFPVHFVIEKGSQGSVVKVIEQE
ncbi:MAG: SMC family ATPase [Candidatus Dependentiae bacterium]|nr:SMC family ATPase [Candidatus Dependentiae bacterium]